MAKLPYDDLQAMKELLGKAGATAPASVPQTRPDYDTNDLEDVGYEPPTPEQINSSGFQAASKYLKNSTPIVGTKAAELLGAYKAQENSRQPASEEPGLTLDNAPEQSQDPKQGMTVLLDQYKKLIANRQDLQNNRGYSEGLAQIADALSMHKGKGLQSSSLLKQVQGQNERAGTDIDKNVQDLLGQGKVVDTQNDLQMNDPNSDISKFAREKAIAAAQKSGMDPETVKKLEGMSAKQLEKLGLFKADSAAQARANQLRFERITGPDGVTRTVAINSQTGEIVKDIGQSGFASQFRVDPETGNLIGLSPSSPGKAPIGVTGGRVSQTAPATVTNNVPSAGGETKQSAVEYGSPTALKKVNPNLYKKFSDLQSDFVKDMKDARDVATSATNLSHKLTPGENGVDSGLLGGIQTQAAKMAGQKGVLTDQDLVKFAGAGGVQAAIDRIIDGSFFGKMSDDDVKFFKRFSELMKTSVAEDIQNRSKLFSGQILNEAKDYLPGLTEQDVQKWLNVEQVAPIAQKASGNKITIQDSNGKSHVIDADKLEMAKKRDPGLKVVEGK